MTCPLCLCPESELYDRDKTRSYEICRKCSLVFVPRDDLLSEKSEKERYEAHQNDEEDQGYQNYLGQIVETINPFLPPQSLGLDFGCGKTLLLEKLLEEKGHFTESYDVFFRPDEKVLKASYDFIVLSEVIEHLRAPHDEMKKIRAMLKSSGQLFIKTKVLPSTKENFSNWFYKRDTTHVQFFSGKSFLELARLLELKEAQSIGNDLYLFRDHG